MAPPDNVRLDSWKEIAAYLGRDVRTVIRWEKERALPVHRVPGGKQHGVFSYSQEIEAWLNGSGQPADLGQVVEQPADLHQLPEPPAAQVLGRSRLTVLGTALIFGAVLAGAGAYLFRASAFARIGAPPIRSLAVLPLQNLSGDPKEEYFADGFTESLLTDLARLRPLRVISRTSVMRYKGSRETLPEIGRDLHVDAVIEGSVQRAGGHLRVTTQLVLPATDAHLWAETYDGEVSDFLNLESKVAQAIVQRVKVELTPQEQAQLASQQVHDPSGYDLYLKARSFWNLHTEEGYGRAVEYLQEVVRRDPGFAQAHALLAQCYIWQGMDGVPSEDVRPKAEAEAQKAVALNDRLAEAHAALAAVKAVYDWEWSAAEQEFRAALDLDPKNVSVRESFATFLLIPMHREAEAVAEVQRALEYDPFSPSLETALGFALELSGQSEQALAEYHKALGFEPDYVPAHFHLWQFYLRKKMYEDALREEIAWTRILGIISFEKMITEASATGGYRAALESDLRFTREAFRHRLPASHFRLASLYAALGDKNLAFAELTETLQRRDPTLICLNTEALFEDLHGDPRFRELLHQVGLPVASSVAYTP